MGISTALKDFPMPMSDRAPSDWKTALSYRSYDGFERCADINQDDGISLSSPSVLVFSSAQDPSVPDHRGILLFRYQGLWGAIEFVEINKSGLHYKYWLNTGGRVPIYHRVVWKLRRQNHF